MKKFTAEFLAVSLLAVGGCSTQPDLADAARANAVQYIKVMPDARTRFETRYINPVTANAYIDSLGALVGANVVIGEDCLKNSAFDTKKDRGASATLLTDALGKVVVTAANGEGKLVFTSVNSELVPDAATKLILTKDNPCTQSDGVAFPAIATNITTGKVESQPILSSELQ